MSGDDRRFKICVIGEPSVGKTSLIRRYGEKEFDLNQQSTSQYDLKEVHITLGGKTYVASVWDTAGQERFLALTKTFFRKAQAIVFVFDVTNRDTLDSLYKWNNVVNSERTCDNVLRVVVGNKTDLHNKRTVDCEEGNEVATEIGAKYWEASAHWGENVDIIFQTIVHDIVNAMPEKSFEEIDNSKISLKPGVVRSRSLCSRCL